MSNTKSELGTTWICTTCKKAVTTDQTLTQCRDCGGNFRPATGDDLACGRCDADDAKRLTDRRGKHDRLCENCIEEIEKHRDVMAEVEKQQMEEANKTRERLRGDGMPVGSPPPEEL